MDLFSTSEDQKMHQMAACTITNEIENDVSYPFVDRILLQCENRGPDSILLASQNQTFNFFDQVKVRALHHEACAKV